MRLIVLTGHIEAILLHVVAVVAEAIDCLVADVNACLNQLVVFIVTHGDRGIECTGNEQVHTLSEVHPLVVQVFLLAHADGQMAKAQEEAHACAFLRERVFATCRDDDHGVVHRCL